MGGALNEKCMVLQESAMGLPSPGHQFAMLVLPVTETLAKMFLLVEGFPDPSTGLPPVCSMPPHFIVIIVLPCLNLVWSPFVSGL